MLLGLRPKSTDKSSNTCRSGAPLPRASCTAENRRDVYCSCQPTHLRSSMRLSSLSCILSGCVFLSYPGAYAFMHKMRTQKRRSEPFSPEAPNFMICFSLVLHGILGERAAWGRVCGRAKLLAGTLRCLHLCWRLPWDLSDEGQLGRCPKPHKGRCPLTLQGALPLDPFSRLGWSHFHAPSACSFWGLRLSPCLLSQLSVKNQTKSSPERRRMSNSQRMPLGKSTSCAE